MGGMAFLINVARAVSGFVKISRAFTRRETMLFPSSLISSRRRGNQPVYSSLARQSVFPFRTRALVRPFTGYLPRIKEDPFHPGMSQRGLHESRAMQWPRQVRRDECETRSKPAVSIRQSNAA